MMNILFNWNSSVTNAPAGYDVAGFEADIEAAGAQIDQLLSSTNITLSVTVGLGEIGGMPMPAGDGGDGGAFPNTGAWMSYADTIQELKTHTTNQANLAHHRGRPQAGSDPERPLRRRGGRRWA
jgi:hypothetical protein